MKMNPIADAYPLSPMQQGMLFHSLSTRQPGVDIEQILCTLREPVDAQAFARAWERAVERHPILRTSFRWQGVDTPRQEVHPAARLPFESRDWRSLPACEQQTQLEDCLRAERAKGFDLTVPPLMRLALFRTGETEHQLVWTFHHLLLDGRGVVLLLQEVFALYSACCRGEELELEP